MTKFLMAVAAAALAMTAQAASAITTFNFSFAGTTTETGQAFSGAGIFTADDGQPAGGTATSYAIQGISGSVNLGGTDFAITDLIEVSGDENSFLTDGTSFQLVQLTFTFAATNFAVFTLDEAALLVDQAQLTVDPTNFAITAVPEPATWALMLTGFALVGTALRRRRTAVRVA